MRGILTGLVALWAACGAEAPPDADGGPDLSKRVGFAEVEAPARVSVATLPAEVVPAPGGRHDLGPGVSGRIVRWLVTEGDEVVAGAPLAELTSPQLEALASSKGAQSSAVAQAQEALRLAEAGAARGVRSAADVQAAQAELAAARGAWRGAQGQLAALDTLTRAGDRWVWTAPSAGVVDHVRCGLGGVQAADVCLGLVASGGVVLRVDVPERHLLSLGGRVQADFVAADGRSWTFEELGRAPAVDTYTRARTYRFGLVDGGEPPLQGMSGRARLSVKADGTVHQVATSALTWVDGVPTVFVRRGEGHEADPKTVEVLGRSDGLAVVRGLQPEDEVAVRGVFLLKSLAAMDDGAHGGEGGH